MLVLRSADIAKGRRRAPAKATHLLGRLLGVVLPQLLEALRLCYQKMSSARMSRGETLVLVMQPAQEAVTVAAGRLEPTVRAPGAVARGCSARRTPAAPVAGDAHSR